MLGKDAPPTSKGDHSRLSCSGAARWLICAASIPYVEQLGIKDKVNRPAAEGTVAHSVCEDSVRDAVDPWIFKGQTRKANGIEFEITSEMLDAVQVYVDYITDLHFKGPEKLDVGVEKKLKLTRLGVEGMDGGTGDCEIIYHAEQHAYIVDYKHGKGVSVDVKYSSQLGLYGVGTLIRLVESGVNIDNWTITMVIVQPRAPHTEGPIREWEVSAKWLLAWALTVIVPRGHAVNEPNPKFTASTEGCRFCPANVNCETLDNFTQDMAVLDFDDFDIAEVSDNSIPLVNQLTSDQKLKIMLHANLIKKYVTAVTDQVATEIMEGSMEYNGHLKAVRKITRRRFKDNAGGLLRSYLSEDEVYDKKLKGLGELEKTLNREYEKDTCKDVMAAITEKPEGAITVVTLSDKRNAVAMSAEDEFADYIDCQEYEEL